MKIDSEGFYFVREKPYIQGVLGDLRVAHAVETSTGLCVMLDGTEMGWSPKDFAKLGYTVVCKIEEPKQ